MVEFLAFALVNLLGTMSPGPDFAIVTRYGLTGSRKAALYATLGITAALLIHISYCIFGVALFLQTSPLLFRTVQITGAIYLGYLGFKLIRASQKPVQLDEKQLGKRAFATGFLTNLLNPKATLFILSVFAQFVTPATTLSVKMIFGLTVPLIAFGWFGFVSYFLTHPAFLPYFQRFQKLFILSMGILLCLLAAYVLQSAALQLF